MPISRVKRTGGVCQSFTNCASPTRPSLSGSSCASGSATAAVQRSSVTDGREARADRPMRVLNASPWPGMTTSASARTRSRWKSRSAWSGRYGSMPGRPVGPPPEVGQRVDPVLRVDDERGVLLGVAGRQPELGVGRHAPAVAAVIEPQVVPVARPEVDDLGVREQRDVHRVIGVVVAEEDVGHGLRRRRRAPRADRGCSPRDATRPGSTTIRASPSRTNVMLLPTRVPFSRM